jgi:cytochrome c peroxidase
MWDGREPSLFSQAVDATLTHAQASATPTPTQQQ